MLPGSIEVFLAHILKERGRRDQWSSLSDNLVPLCKSQIIIIQVFLEIVVFTVDEHEYVFRARLNRRASYATGWDVLKY